MLAGAKFSFIPKVVHEEIHASWSKRWVYMHTTLHGAGYYCFSASSRERNRSAHGHIHPKVRNKLEPATTEKLVYAYANSKMLLRLVLIDLKMFAWDNKDTDAY